MKELSIINPQDYGLEKKNVQSIEVAFAPKIEERKELAKIYKNLISRELDISLCDDASDLRKKLVKVRTGIANVHKAQKSYFLASGKFVDAWKNKETLPITQMEEKLKEIENHFENIRIEEIKELQKLRVSKIEKYVEDAFLMDLASMEDDVFDAYYHSKKKHYEDAIIEENRLNDIRIEDEKKEKAKRIEEERIEKEKKERIEKENAQLKKEAKKKEEERLRLEKVEQEKARKVQAELDRKIKAEQEKVRKVQAELDRKIKEDAERLQLEEDEKQLELSKGDSDKVLSLIKDFNDIKKFVFKSKSNKKAFSDVCNLIDKIVIFSEKNFN